MKLKFTSIVSISLISVLTVTAVAADFKAITTHRQGIYTIASGHMKAMKSILFEGLDRTSDIKYHATEIQNAFRHHGNAFPEGSHVGKTRALKSIWEKPEEFKKAGQNLGEALAGLIEAADFEDVGEMQAAFKKVGKGCKGCHDDFREEK